MSQAAVERILGKVVTDETFRVRFFRDRAAASFAAGLVFSKTELDALSRLPVELIARFSASLDDRICRLPFEEEHRPASASALEEGEDPPPAGSPAVVGTARRACRTRAQDDSPGGSPGGGPHHDSHDESQ
jgi:hypothetical protein